MLNTKEDILKNHMNQTVDGSHFFFSINILQNIFCVQQKNEIQTGLYMTGLSFMGELTL